MEINKIYNGDCLELMKDILNKSIDMILCDLPYGTTACKWDTIIPFEPLWKEYKRIIKDNGAIVLTASQPFTSALVMSNPKWFRHEWIWEKERGANFLQANRQPNKVHENVLVFGKQAPRYFPIKTLNPRKRSILTPTKIKQFRKDAGLNMEQSQSSSKYEIEYLLPRSIQRFIRENSGKYVHPTQKPVALFEYLIKTYTSVGDTVLDNCIGSGTTAVAAINTGRNFIGIEMDKGYCEIANKRIQEAKDNLASKLPL